jgi:FkbM family methyltransferase
VLSDSYLLTAEQDARKFSGAYTGTSGTLAAHVMRLLADRRELLSGKESVMSIEENWLADAVADCIRGIEHRELSLDVGANRGDWSVELAKVFRQVVAFEPDPRVSAEIPQLPNLQVRSEAVSGSCGVAEFHLRPDAGQNSLLAEHPIGGGSQAPAPVIETVSVNLVTLDAVAPGGADFVKIDTEGAEVEILRGCQNLHAWARAYFVVECHDTKEFVADELWRLGKSLLLIRHPSPSAHPGHCWIVASPMR